MIIDCHGHYTTAPAPLQAYRDAQLAALKDAGALALAAPRISDDGSATASRRPAQVCSASAAPT